jgi:hypothetical protein
MNKSRWMRWMGYVARERKRPLRRTRHSWEDNIRMNLEKIGWEVVDWRMRDCSVV